ncbi:peptidase domain-containing ABC transporter [Oryzibacter oryziterrae]|uniref:peptidase domain-containing ABC transporter n=1 Tax=Oryzibacter oryziterrae TaxID=2766474 RepID=UPI001F2BD1A9|nr:peptidase domain-containing ABC transporter [Oryzibacter oryziterrae]
MTTTAPKQLAARETPAPVGRSLVEALVIVGRHHDQVWSTERIERVLGAPASSVGWSDLERVASLIGLRSSVTKLKAGYGLLRLKKLPPSIVLLKSGLAMVLVKVEEAEGTVVLTLQDPLAAGDAMVRLDAIRFEAACTGDIMFLKRDYPFESDAQPFGLRSVAGRIFQSRTIVRDLLLASFMLGLLSASPIVFWRLLIDRVLFYNASNTMVVLCIAMVILVTFETAFAWLKRHMSQNIVRRIDVALWNKLFDELLKLPISFFERSQTGVITRDMFELTKIRNFLTDQLFGVALDSLILIVFIPVLFLFSVKLTLIVLALCALICVWIVVMLPVLHVKNQRVFRAEGNKGAFLVETLHGIRTVKSLSLDDRRRREWDVLVARAANLRYDESSTVNLISTVLLPLERLMTSGVIAVAVYLAITSHEQVYVGALFAFMMLTMRVAAPLMQLSGLIQAYDEARTAVETIRALVNQPKESGRSSLALHTPLTGRIEFRDVTFSYPGSLTPALDKLTFTIPQGTIFGIVGRSGSGKTTITRLLQVLHSDYLGMIRIDGINLSQFDVDHVRSSIGVVLQDNFLFSGTVADSIRAACPGASFDQVVRAARLAGAEEFIERLPDGYNTFIFEGSANLSGGQRQRLAIARALINDPKVLILDEATSALDAESEAIVNANLLNIANGRTVIIISHRLSSLVQADSILVLERGLVYDNGPHEDLLDRCDIYRNLWDQQHRHLNLKK